jgi:hypothetical protein
LLAVVEVAVVTLQKLQLEEPEADIEQVGLLELH